MSAELQHFREVSASSEAPQAKWGQYWDPPGARAQGLAACADMALGSNWSMTVTKLMNIGYTLGEASTILAAATVAYCPGLDPRIQAAAPEPDVAPEPMQLA